VRLAWRVGSDVSVMSMNSPPQSVIPPSVAGVSPTTTRSAGRNVELAGHRFEGPGVGFAPAAVDADNNGVEGFAVEC